MAGSINSSWQRIREWLEAQAPQVLEELEDGASPEEIQDLAQATALEIPADLREFLALVNGGDSSGLFPSRDDYDEMAYSPISIEQIIDYWKSMNHLLEGGDFAGNVAKPDAGVAADWWNAGWIPFATNGGGDLFCIDMAPTIEGTPGQVVSFSHETGTRKKLADSLSLYLEQLADDLDAGRIRYDDDWGLVSSPHEE